MIGATPLQIELTLIRMSEHQSKNTSAAHLEAFYQPFREARRPPLRRPDRHRRADRAPRVRGGRLLDELRALFDWTQTNVHSTMGVCWGGMAMLHHFHGTPKHILPAKAFGCFRHVALEPPSAALLQGFSDSFLVPVSRWTEVRDEDLAQPGAARADPLRRRRAVPRRGPGAPRLLHVQPPRVRLDDPQGRVRARPRRRRADLAPVNYFPDDDPAQPPENRWRSHGQLLYGNWINEIYQTTPYETEAIGA